MHTVAGELPQDTILTFYCFEVIHIRDKPLFCVITEFMPTGTLHTSKEIKTLSES